MDRSDRARYARRTSFLLIALAMLAGCNGRLSAPATTAPATSAASGQVSGDSAEPQRLACDPHVAPATAKSQGDMAVPVDAILPAVPTKLSATETALQKTAIPEFSICGEDAGRRSEAPAHEEEASEDAPPCETPKAAADAPKTIAQPTVAAAPARIERQPTIATPTIAAPTKAELEIAKSAAEAAPPDTLLPWGPAEESPEMAAVNRRAEETARHGFDLAERGALYTARAQFIEVLRSVAQAIDAQRGTTAHTKALSVGLRALEEVDDFVPRGTRLETDLNLKQIVDAHRTPVLKDRPLDDVTAMDAQRLYLTYAQEQLSAAAGDQSVASLALHGLGKVCAAPAALHGPHEQIAEAKAVVFYQAALIADPRNSVSANELGVLLVRFGHLDEARLVLERSAGLSNAPTSWRNLAVVYQRMGDAQQAQIARQQGDAAVAQSQHAGNTSAGQQYPITWLEPESFARTNSMVGTQSVAVPPQATPAVPQTAAKTDKKTGSWYWPWK